MKIIISALIRISFNRPLVGSFEPLGLAIVITGILIDLNKFLYKPKLYAKGTKMNYAGLSKVKDRANLIAWLRTKSDNPVSLPK